MKIILFRNGKQQLLIDVSFFRVRVRINLIDSPSQRPPSRARPVVGFTIPQALNFRSTVGNQPKNRMLIANKRARRSRKIENVKIS